MKPILVPVDGSDCSMHALDFAVELASSLGAEIVICHVLDLGRAAAMSAGAAQLVEESIEVLRAEGKEIIDRAVARAGSKVHVSARVPDGAPVEQIERLAAELPASFIVLGTHGRSGLERLLMGSVAEGVVRAASVPAMVVPCDVQGARKR
ncbi:MAG TPA: universal stress protein [Candidatus Cybelea sp.]|jgi:nucleotide-binding universal stress UspA family protein